VEGVIAAAPSFNQEILQSYVAYLLLRLGFRLEGLLTLDLPRCGSSPELGSSIAFGELGLRIFVAWSSCPSLLPGERDGEDVAENLDGPATMEAIVTMGGENFEPSRT
jgi:hypothetical protein